ncbi:MAG: hypothetical protein WB780_00895 [Candidatus Acidiferrales bacterium]
MSNQAYLNVWCQDFPEERILERFGDFLATVPFSATKPGFKHLVIRAVDFTENPILEQDLRSVPHDTAGILEIAKDHLNSDCAYEVRADWDLWVFEGEPGHWQHLPQPLGLACYGEDFDEGYWQENGHLEANLGFEHLFTGHAGLLGFRQSGSAPPQSAEEARFLESMEQPENLQIYRDKTRENIRKLFAWVRQIEKALPGARIRLWSEGEENFEARLEEILAAR